MTDIELKVGPVAVGGLTVGPVALSAVVLTAGFALGAGPLVGNGDLLLAGENGRQGALCSLTSGRWRRRTAALAG